MSISILEYPTIQPSLTLDFAKAKQLDPRIAVTRASSGTYVGSDGLIKTAGDNEPRFNHDPTTGESLGLLTEESRTNLVLYSEGFDDAAWTNNASVTANTATSPAGTSTADTLAISTAGQWLFQDQTIASGATLAFSIYAKANATNWILVRIADTGNTTYQNVWFDLGTGTIGTESGLGAGVTSGVGSIQQFANGFYRIVGIFATSGLTTIRVQITTVDADGSFTRAGSVDIWGAQLEVGAFPTSYIPTTSSTVTRAADVVSISGSNFSGWYHASESTVFANWENLAATMPSGSAQWLAEFSDGTTSNRQSLFQIQAANSLISQNSFTSGSGAGRLDAGGSYSKIVAKASAVFASFDRALAVNGGLAVASFTGSIPPGLDRLNIGATFGTSHLNGTIRRLTYWPQRLPNDTLQTITQ